jgi:cell division protein FtsL
MSVAVLFRRVSTARYQRDVRVRIMPMAFMVVFLLAVAVTVTSVVMAMVMMAKASHSYQVNCEAHRADYEKLCQSLRLMSLRKALNRLDYNLNTDKPRQKLA